jgi:3-keto-5-aminohexanoate cleavage enzyme
MNAKELLEKYRDLKMAEVIRYNQDVYCDVTSIPKWNIPDKIHLGVAITGSFIDKSQNPNQPIATQEILKEVMACIEAGARWIHFHVRDEKGRNIGDVEEYKKIVYPVREKYGDTVFIDGCPLFGKNFEEACAPVTEGLLEIGIVNPVCTFVSDNVRYTPPPVIRAQCEYFQALGKKVKVSVHDTASIDNINRFLIRPGILQKPYYFGIVSDLPGMFYMPNPRAMVEGLTLLVNRLKELDPDCEISVCASGRASMYLATLAILMGLHVRVGTEDTIWLYPHRDEKIKSNLEAFQTAKALCELLGREIASAEEHRRAIGVKKPHF